LKFGVSYHRERHYWFFAKEKKKGGTPHDDISREIELMPKAVDLYGPFTMSDEFMVDYVKRWEEICRKYQPDFMWLDDSPARGDQEKIYLKHCVKMIADYLNKAEEWNKELYLNNKGGQPNWPVDCGCREKDNLKLPNIGPKWQNPATLGTSYGYMKAEEQRDAYKSPTQLIHLLCDVVSKNGNLLLNIGPRADGTIPDGMKRRLLAMGEWLNVNGEAIYGTRYWKTFGQNTPALRFTIPAFAGTSLHPRKRVPKVLYAIALDKPTAEFTIKSTKGFSAGQVESVTLLGSSAKVAWLITDRGLQIIPPKDILGEYAWVFKIRMAPPQVRRVLK